MAEVGKPHYADQLTQRELEILRLIAGGMTNQEIAGHLFIAFETVKWYLKQIYAKLNVSRRAEAIAVAHAAGLLDDGAPKIEPPAPPHALPLPPTPFIGRDAELAELARYLADPACRLFTLVGAGGIGKTRLALEAAAAQQTRFRDGVYFISLAPLSDPHLIPTAIAEVIGLAFAPGPPPKNQLLNFLRNRHSLLVLDNLEHLLAGIGFIAEVLQTAPGIKLLVTSRERLQLQSEVVFRLDGFTFAEWATPEAIAESNAGQLFLQSARRVKPSFELTRDDLPALSAICRLLRGMPLGILLAAAWVDGLTTPEIAREIEADFEFLEGDWRDLPERQRSLRAVFEHSWSLLTEPERSAMRAFSVFRGGFTRETAQQVAEVSLRTLISLVNKSLLNRAPSGRFDLHELLRQYAAGKLEAQPDDAERIQARHAAYYARFMDSRWKPIRSATMKVAAADIEREMENVRAAWGVLVDQSQFASIGMTSPTLWYFLMARSRYEEGRDLFGQAADTLRALPGSEARDLALGEVLHTLGFFETASGQAEQGKALTEESLTILRGRQAAEIMARAYITLCRSEFLLGEFQSARQHAQQGIALGESLDDPWYVGPCQFLVGMIEVDLGHYEDALNAGEKALQSLERAGDSYYQGLCFGLVLGRAAMRMRNFEDAKRFYQRSIAYFESIHDGFEIAQSSRDLSEIYALTNDAESAQYAYQNSLRYYASAGQIGFLISTLRPVASVAEMQHDYAQAVELLALMVNHPATLPVDRQQAQAALTRQSAQLSADDFAAAYAHGKALDLDTVVVKLLGDR